MAIDHTFLPGRHGLFPSFEPPKMAMLFIYLSPY
jgi:hypothetical protein